MPVTSDKPAPYAPARLVIDILTRYREKGLPSPVDDDVLKRVGVTDSLMRRTVLTLQILDLIDEKCVPTAVLEGLRSAPEVEYKGRVAQWLNAAYADVLKFVDPGMSDETKVTDAFRTYEPAGMRDRMVSLFMALYAYAGVGKHKSGARSGRATKFTPNGAPKRAARKAEPHPSAPPLTAKEPAKPGETKDAGVKDGTRSPVDTGHPRSLEQILMEKFPAFDPDWDDRLKDQWFAGFDRLMALIGAK